MQKINSLQSIEKLFITDIGSTTTKGLLLVKNDTGRWQFACQEDVYTTVEKPHEDVNIGLANCIQKIIKAALALGVIINDFEQIPYLTTSSAGGGLQMISLGLTKIDTGKIAEMTVLDAGGVLLRSFAIDDGLKDDKKMGIIKNLHPDMILMGGGYDGGRQPGILHFMTILNEAAPEPRYTKHLKTPLIYCGNQNMSDFIEEFLEEKFDIHLVPNIRPNAQEYNVIPAKEAVHSIFKEKVMQRAPGFSRLKDRVAVPVLPTPTAVEKIIKLYADQENKNLLLVDMGGATTDIYAFAGGDFQRTVAANVGLSYSMANIMATLLKSDDFKALQKHFPKTILQADIRNYAYNKTLNPAYLPKTEAEYLIEQIFALIGFQIAWKQHQEMNFNPVEENVIEKKNVMEKFINNPKILLDYFKKKGEEIKQIYFEEEYSLKNGKKFKLSQLDTIIGSGGVIAYAQSDLDRIQMLCDGFLPWGITKLDIDRPFKVSHMGLLSEIDGSLALELFTRQCIKPLAYIVAPFGICTAGKPVLRIHDKKTGLTFKLSAGEVKFLADGGSYILETIGLNYLRNEIKKEALETDLPILLDCRGRGNYFNEKSLYESGFNIKGKFFFTTQIPLNNSQPVKLKKEIFRRYYIQNENYLVKLGQYVKADQIIATHFMMNPRKYVVDLPRGFGLSEISPEVLNDFLQVKIGEVVERNQEVFRVEAGSWNHNKRVISIKVNRKGVLLKITKRGVLIFKEILLESEHSKEYLVNKYLKLKKENIAQCLKVSKGDFVTTGEIIAEKIAIADNRSGIISTMRAEQTGFISGIDYEKGIVYLLPGLKRKNVVAYINGQVSAFNKKNKAIELEFNGMRLLGKIGFGGENFGLLKLASLPLNLEGLKGCIVVFKTVLTLEILKKLKNSGIKGIIAPSIESIDWHNFSDKSEIGVALTGDEELPFTLILLEGFGNLKLQDSHYHFFRENENKICSISGRTQIRAGVMRPEILISE